MKRPMRASKHLTPKPATLPRRALTSTEFSQLSAVPPETERFANIDNPHTRRAYLQHHTYAESIPNQGSRDVLSYTRGPRKCSVDTASPHQSMARVVSKLATRTTIEQNSETSAVPEKVNRPATVAKTAAPSARPRFNHDTPTRAAPARQ